MNRQKLVDELARTLRYARPDEEKGLEMIALRERMARREQWETDVRAIQLALQGLWGNDFQWALFWTKVNEPKEGA